MNNIFKSTLIAVAVTALTGCSDYIDKRDPNISSEGYFETELGLSEGLNAIYVNLAFNGDWGAPSIIEWDNWSPYGMVFREETVGMGSGYGITPDEGNILNYYKGNYRIVARANSVIAGNNGKWVDQSDEAKCHYSEARVLRAYGFYNLMSMFGDIIMPTHPVQTDEFTMPATPKEDVMDFILTELDEAAEYLPWTPAQRGRITKAFAYGLAARASLFAAGYDFGGKSADYYKLAADYAKKVIDSKQYDLSPVYLDLFVKAGQAKPETQKELIMEMMFSDDETDKTVHYGFYSSGIYAGGGSAQDACYRMPTNMLVDQFECKDGLRIDESKLYNPRRPYLNRDPRMRWTLAMHGDTINFTVDAGVTVEKIIVNNYDATTRWTRRGRWTSTNNTDVTTTQNRNSYVQCGLGYVWRKYCEDMDKFGNNHNQNISMMRYAEILLTYAEAKIELNQMDETVYEAINKVRRRAKMPDFDKVDPTRKGDQAKMRQIVRRERRCELAWEGLLLNDYRRWDIGDLLMKYPLYGYPVKDVKYSGLAETDIPNFKWDPRADLNDVPSYEAYKDKLTMRAGRRHWDPKYRFFPYPQTEINRCPQLSNPNY